MLQLVLWQCAKDANFVLNTKEKSLKNQLTETKQKENERKRGMKSRN